MSTEAESKFTSFNCVTMHCPDNSIISSEKPSPAAEIQLLSRCRPGWSMSGERVALLLKDIRPEETRDFQNYILLN